MTCITLLPNLEKEGAYTLSLEIIKRLKQRNITPVVPLALHEQLRNQDGVFLFCENLLPYLSLCIVLGGDGSILAASKHTAPWGIPILGFHFGRVGFMAELEKDELHYLDDVLDGKSYTVEERSMLKVTLPHGKEVTALNDVLITNPGHAMLDADVLADGSLLQHYHADGLLFSTPTGSTAHNLAAGGAILDAGLQVISFIPICPHTLYRTPPVVFSSSSVLTVSSPSTRSGKLDVVADGRVAYTLQEGDSVIITGSEQKTRLVRVKHQNVHSLLARKLAESYHKSNLYF